MSDLQTLTDRIAAAEQDAKEARRVFEEKTRALTAAHVAAAWVHLKTVDPRVDTVILEVTGFEYPHPTDHHVRVAYLLAGDDEIEPSTTEQRDALYAALEHLQDAWVQHETIGFGTDLFTAEEDYDSAGGETSHYSVESPV